MRWTAIPILLGALVGCAEPASTMPVPKLAYVAADGRLAVWSQDQVETVAAGPLDAGELAWSPAGDRVAHVGSRRLAAAGDPIVVSIFGLDGEHSVVQLPRADNLAMWRGAEEIHWPAEGRLGVAGSIDPSTAVMIMIDPASGGIEALHHGKFFVFSPSGKSLATIGWIPHFAPPEVRNRDYVQIDGETIYPPGGGRGSEGQIGPPLLWHPRQPRLAFVERRPGGVFLVVAGSDGEARDFPLADGRQLHAWSDDGSSLLLAGEEDAYFEVDAASGSETRTIGERFSQAYGGYLEAESRRRILRRQTSAAGSWWPRVPGTPAREGSEHHGKD